MRRLSAQFIITNSGSPLKRAIIDVSDDGTVMSISGDHGSDRESSSVEFYNGVIIPGFVNCHCHLELSNMKDSLRGGKGLPGFIMDVRNSRSYKGDPAIAARSADNIMAREGIVVCGDICNNSSTFKIKKESSITYHSFLEVFGIDPEKAGKRMAEAASLAKEAETAGIPCSIVPHSLYSVSIPLLGMIKEKTRNNPVTTIHFMETGSEEEFLNRQEGPLRESYSQSGILPEVILTPSDHVSGVLNDVTSSGNLILVHNTFAEPRIVREIKTRSDTFWCLCPGANLFIENKMPPVEMLMSEGCEIVLGTDSLASNDQLSILSEMKIIHRHIPSLSLQESVRWGTINGARALRQENIFGKIEPGMKPGILLLENLDLVNMKLLPETSVIRLI